MPERDPVTGRWKSRPWIVEERLLENIEFQSNRCWRWTGTFQNSGYGWIYRPTDKRNVIAHRLTYEFLRGPIPEGKQIDHLCRNRWCVNPRHLEPVTQRENVLRGEGACAKHARKTHCKRGHEFTPENTRRRSDGGRECRTCQRVHERFRHDPVAREQALKAITGGHG